AAISRSATAARRRTASSGSPSAAISAGTAGALSAPTSPRARAAILRTWTFMSFSAAARCGTAVRARRRNRPSAAAASRRRAGTGSLNWAAHSSTGRSRGSMSIVVPPPSNRFLPLPVRRASLRLDLLRQGHAALGLAGFRPLVHRLQLRRGEGAVMIVAEGEDRYVTVDAHPQFQHMYPQADAPEPSHLA